MGRASEVDPSAGWDDVAPFLSLSLSLSDLLSYSLFIEIGNKMVEGAARGTSYHTSRSIGTIQGLKGLTVKILHLDKWGKSRTTRETRTSHMKDFKDTARREWWDDTVEAREEG